MAARAGGGFCVSSRHTAPQAVRPLWPARARPAMSLSAREQQILNAIGAALGAADPGLADLMNTFARLTAGEAMPTHEQAPVRRQWHSPPFFHALVADICRLDRHRSASEQWDEQSFLHRILACRLHSVTRPHANVLGGYADGLPAWRPSARSDAASLLLGFKLIPAPRGTGSHRL